MAVRLKLELVGHRNAIRLRQYRLRITVAIDLLLLRLLCLLFGT